MSERRPDKSKRGEEPSQMELVQSEPLTVKEVAGASVAVNLKTPVWFAEQIGRIEKPLAELLKLAKAGWGNAQTPLPKAKSGFDHSPSRGDKRPLAPRTRVLKNQHLSSRAPALFGNSPGSSQRIKGTPPAPFIEEKGKIKTAKAPSAVPALGLPLDTESQEEKALGLNRASHSGDGTPVAAPASPGLEQAIPLPEPSGAATKTVQEGTQSKARQGQRDQDRLAKKIGEQVGDNAPDEEPSRSKLLDAIKSSEGNAADAAGLSLGGPIYAAAKEFRETFLKLDEDSFMGRATQKIGGKVLEKTGIKAKVVDPFKRGLGVLEKKTGLDRLLDWVGPSAEKPETESDQLKRLLRELVDTKDGKDAGLNGKVLERDHKGRYLTKAERAKGGEKSKPWKTDPAGKLVQAALASEDRGDDKAQGEILGQLASLNQAQKSGTEDIVRAIKKGGGGGGLFDLLDGGNGVGTKKKGRVGTKGVLGAGVEPQGRLGKIKAGLGTGVEKVGAGAAKAGRFLKSAKGAGLVGAVLSAGMLGMEAYDQYQALDAQGASGEQKGESMGGTLAKGVGGLAGAAGGAATGAAIGSIVPVVGTALGGLIGGALGYYGGEAAAEFLGLDKLGEGIGRLIGGWFDSEKDNPPPGGAERTKEGGLFSGWFSTPDTAPQVSPPKVAVAPQALPSPVTARQIADKAGGSGRETYKEVNNHTREKVTTYKEREPSLLDRVPGNFSDSSLRGVGEGLL